MTPRENLIKELENKLERDISYCDYLHISFVKGEKEILALKQVIEELKNGV